MWLEKQFSHQTIFFKKDFYVIEFHIHQHIRWKHFNWRHKLNANVNQVFGEIRRVCYLNIFAIILKLYF